MYINVNCNQLEMELQIPFQSNAPASQIIQELVQQLSLSQETQVILTMNSKKIDPKQNASLQKITSDTKLDAKFTQNVQVIFRNQFQLDISLYVNLWSNVNSLQKSLLSQLYSLHQYEVLFKLDGQYLQSDKLCYAQDIRANSVIYYEIFIPFFALYQNQRVPFRVNAFITIDDLKKQIQQEFNLNRDVRLKYGELELIEETLFCYSLEPKTDLIAILIQEQLLTIFLCNASRYTDERQIEVKDNDLVGILDQHNAQPGVQYTYKFQEEVLDKMRSFKDQGIGNKAKIRFLALIMTNQIKIFFFNKLTDIMAELEVQPNDQFDDKIKILLKDEITQSRYYCFEYQEQKITNLQQTFQQLQMKQGDTITYYPINLKLEIVYNNEQQELIVPFDSTVATMRALLEQQLKLKNIEIFQEGAELTQDILIKDTYMKPYYLKVQKPQQDQEVPQEQSIDEEPPQRNPNPSSSIFDIQIVTILIQPFQCEIVMEVNKYNTIKSLLAEIRQSQELPPNQPIFVYVNDEQLEEDTLLLNLFNIVVEIVNFLTVFFKNIQTNEIIEVSAIFEDQIKIYVDLNKIPNSNFQFNNQQININQSFKDAQIGNNDIICYEIIQQEVVEYINIDFRFKQGEQIKLERIENIRKDILVKELQDAWITKYSLDRDSVLNYQGKRLNEQLSLKDNNVKNNSLITTSPLLISIIIKDKNQNSQRQKFVRPKQKVSEIIEQLARETNQVQIELISNYNPLNGNSTFAEQGLANGSVIELNY